MEKKTKIRLAGLIILATAVLSLILVLFTDSWPLAIAIAVVVMASASAGFYWYSRRQQGQFIERLKKFDIDPEKGRVNEANLRRMYHSGGQAQKDAINERSVKATPHNSARNLSERFCASSKFRKRGNTVCIFRFWNCRTGAKDPLRSADVIVRCCLNTHRIFFIPCPPPYQRQGMSR